MYSSIEKIDATQNTAKTKTKKDTEPASQTNTHQPVT